MSTGTDSLACADCGCMEPVVQRVENALVFKKRLHGRPHKTVILLPQGVNLEVREFDGKRYYVIE